MDLVAEFTKAAEKRLLHDSLRQISGTEILKKSQRNEAARKKVFEELRGLQEHKLDGETDLSPFQELIQTQIAEAGKGWEGVLDGLGRGGIDEETTQALGDLIGSVLGQMLAFRLRLEILESSS